MRHTHGPAILLLGSLLSGCPQPSAAPGASLASRLNEAIAGRAVQPTGRFLRNWLVCGEFPSPPRETAEAGAAPQQVGLDRDHLDAAGGEAAIRPQAGMLHARPDGSPAIWQMVYSPTNHVDLEQVYQGARPTSNVSAYAYTSFVAVEPETAYLALASDDAVRVWLNGELVHEARGDRQFEWDQDVVTVRLEAGLNHLLIKSDHGTAGWKFAARVATRSQAFPEATDGDLLLRYGRGLYSRNNEELIIRHFFADRKGGFFVDVGAGHYRDESNTFYLEERLGWSGIAIDALGEFAPDYERFRPRSAFLNYAVTDQNEGTLRFFRSRTWVLSSTRKDLAERTGLEAEIDVPQTTLDRVLDERKVEKIDFLTMDIELGEPAALAGFDIQRFRPELVCIEAWGPVQEEVAAYFRRNGYRRIHTYLVVDPVNWYYTPIE